jgi:membrane associated rhomboid family serine protease
VFPYHDENVTRRTAVVTMTLIVACVAAWLMVQGAGAAMPLASSVCNLGLIAGELTGSVPPGTEFPMGDRVVCLTDPGMQLPNVLTHMFLHGSWMHLLGNMWFLWLFGNNIEDSMTRPRFLAFYLLCGLAAALLQVFTDPASPIPMVGASGAISGVMGAYLVLFPRVRVFTVVPLGFFITTMALPAWVMLIYWAFLQMAGGLVRISETESGGGVAFWAHIGGFVAGVVLVKLFAVRRNVEAHQRTHWQPHRQPWRQPAAVTSRPRRFVHWAHRSTFRHRRLCRACRPSAPGSASSAGGRRSGWPRRLASERRHANVREIAERLVIELRQPRRIPRVAARHEDDHTLPRSRQKDTIRVQ